MSRTLPFIRVVVLAFDGAEMTLECIESIRRSEWPEDRIEIVLVDNGSLDDVVDRVRTRFPSVRLVEPMRNLGFAGGCNAGISATESSNGVPLTAFDHVALVNNDAVVFPDWLTPLVRAIEADDRIGAASPKMLFASKFQEVEVSRLFPDDPLHDREPLCVTAVRLDGSRVDTRIVFDEGFDGPSPFSKHSGEEMARWTHRGGRVRIVLDGVADGATLPIAIRLSARVSGAAIVRTDSGEGVIRVGESDTSAPGSHCWVDCEIPTRGFDVINNVGSELYIGGSAGDRGFLERDRGQFDSPTEIFAWCGGAVLLSKEYLADVGLFDEEFFLYYEDTDLSWRGRLRGWRYVYVPTSVVRHRHAQSSIAGSDEFRFRVERNRLLVLSKNAPVSVALRSGVGEFIRLISTCVREVVAPVLRLKIPNRREFLIRLRVFRSFVSLLPHALRLRWSTKKRRSRRSVMKWAVNKIVPVPVFDRPDDRIDLHVNEGSSIHRQTAAVFNLYWHTLGGGEVVSGEIARVLSQDHDVTLLGPQQPDAVTFCQRLGIDISSCKWREIKSDAEASRVSAEFDVFVNCTYSSRAVNKARVGLYYVHFPRQLEPAIEKFALEKAAAATRLAMRLRVKVRKLETAERVFRSRLEEDSWVDSYAEFLANSAYTQKWIEKIWNRDSDVLHPPVRGLTSSTTKSPSIVSVGRFFDPSLGHSKKQLEMLTAFADMARSRDGVGDWRLTFVGGADSASRDYVMRLKRAARDLPIDVHVNAPRSVLEDKISKASLYWHASGYGEDEHRHPDRFEHFGIAVVEAMSCGAVPLVFGEAGPAEIVRDGVDGFHWHTLEQLARLTRTLMGDPELRETMSQSAIARSREFEPDVFDARLLGILRDRNSKAQAR